MTNMRYATCLLFWQNIRLRTHLFHSRKLLLPCHRLSQIAFQFLRRKKALLWLFICPDDRVSFNRCAWVFLLFVKMTMMTTINIIIIVLIEIGWRLGGVLLLLMVMMSDDGDDCHQHHHHRHHWDRVAPPVGWWAVFNWPPPHQPFFFFLCHPWVVNSWSSSSLLSA